MRALSKSKLLAFRQCTKRLWLEIHQPELREDSPETEARFAVGHQVGDIARQLFDPVGKGVLVEFKRDGLDAAFAHSQVSHKEWRIFRDALPSNHKWVAAIPSKKKKLEQKQAAGWQILHASIEHGRVHFSANKPGTLHVHLRIQSAEIQCELKFCEQDSEIRAPLDARSATKLGLTSPPYPRFMKVQIPGVGWQNILLNDLDTISGDPKARSLEDLLLWEYTGRDFAKRTRRNKLTSPDDSDDKEPGSAEEEELAQFTHQGELDEMVLKWRVIAKRVALSSGSNDRLRLTRLKDTISRIERSALENPAEWPPFKLHFVRETLRRPWPA